MIEIKQLSLSIGKFSISDINISIRDNEYLVILGPTGAGKTILLECVAGLHRIKHGQILVNGTDVTHLTPEERHLGYVPQDFVLFPFLNVRDNITFGLKKSNTSKKELNERVANLADTLGISHILDRDTRSLSGGEKQRVSIARALAPSSSILLLDEPLSSLDQQTSKHLRLELRRVHKQLGITTIHVTHNQIEAEEIGDRIAILNNGKLEQIDEPHEIFFAPKNGMVSDFIGGLNIFECTSCRTLHPGLLEVECGGMSIVLPHDDEEPVEKIAISPRDVYISDIAPPGPSVNRYIGTIISINHTGGIIKLEIQVGNNIIRVEITNDIFEDMKLSVGNAAYLILKLRRLRALTRKNVG